MVKSGKKVKKPPNSTLPAKPTPTVWPTLLFHKSVLLNTLYVCMLFKNNTEPMKCSIKRFCQNLLTPLKHFGVRRFRAGQQRYKDLSWSMP